jgi:hypothetical protein
VIRTLYIIVPYPVLELPIPKISPAMREFARQFFEQPGEPGCIDCGGMHRRQCPRVKRKTMNADLIVIEVEYWPPGTWESDIIFPEDVYESDDAPGGSGDADESAGDAAPGTELAAYSSGPEAGQPSGSQETG